MNTLLPILILVTFFACKKDPSTEQVPDTSLKGPYLGQTLPGTDPVKFSPSSSYEANGSWWWRSSPAFSPDGNEMYFTRFFYSSQVHEIWYTKNTNGQWTEPQKASFSTTNYDSDVQFLQSNDTIYFYSQRPGKFIYRITRTSSSGWSDPVALNIPLPANAGIITSYAIVKNKTIYFAMLEGSGYNWATADIYRSRFVNGQYTQPEKLGMPVNNANIGEAVGYVDPSERFIIFSSTKTGGYGSYDLYISYKNQDGSWKDPVNLGPKINTAGEEDKLSISPDGKYFFFTSQRSGSTKPFWMDIKGIEAIK